MVSAPVQIIASSQQGQECSTPYGINGFGTHDYPVLNNLICGGAQRLTASMVSAPRFNPMDIKLKCFVLNALRHQWFRHWTRYQCFFAGHIRAQRLTASMVSAQRFRSEHPDEVLLGAQRLTASMVSAHDAITMDSSFHGGAQRLTASMVSALVIGAVRWQITACSTPYGINGFGTTSLVDGK